MADSGIPFRFTRHARIGEAGAEQDDEFLFNNFEDVGDYEELQSLRSVKRIVLGRTGSGKTALLRYLLHREDHVIPLEPEQLSLDYIANNHVIRFFEDLGVKLDLFYGLLWKHVLVVELLKHKFSLNTEEKTQSWVSSISENLRKKDQGKLRAFQYIKDWGDKFWIETESRVKELTTKLSGELEAKGGVPVFSAGASAQMSEEKKIEYVERGQRIVSEIQIKELDDVIKFLDEDVFTDPQKPYYITIDKLDEDWVDESIRYKLIRSLIETVKKFQRIKNVKIIMALRFDLYEKVIKETTDAGFQSEKYDALLLSLRWNSKQIVSLLDKRVGSLVKEQYTARPVSLIDLFPERVGNVKFVEYLMARTALRPRDAIVFVNDCIQLSEDTNRVTAGTVTEAEKKYSTGRRRALLDEWKNLYPSLATCLPLIEGRDIEFKLSSIDKEKIELFALEITENDDNSGKAASDYYAGKVTDYHIITANIFRMFFDIGLVGFKLEGRGQTIWPSSDVTPDVSFIKTNTKAVVHPMFYQAFNIKFKDEVE
ncbi:P-loop ATPase, Sll1717 family [Silvimonas amylolytica]|uniref:DNA repair ATPase n=1 Tax=Silvimonas amylolytica TaxID=449663 RepID=A0ABQ2PHK0_9NEIS|nr:DNA repair protein [Silvimonas amylolytica]GGP24833.1 hypothetical protein GCM10010971_06520 [Silvimonas amylolytica]